MSAVAEKTDPALWEKVKTKVTRDDKGGRPGQWSARKAQLAVQAYKKAGGGYKGRRTDDNHLRQWEREDWGTKSGRKSTETGERYLPRKARAHLSDTEYSRTTAKKRVDTRAGKQFYRQPADVARKTAADRETGTGRKTARGGLGSLTRAELLTRAARQNIPGRFRMRKDELLAALSAR